MSQVKHCTIYLEVSEEDGNLFVSDFKVTPIGGYNMPLESFLTQVADNLRLLLPIIEVGEPDSSLASQADALGS